MQGAGTFSVYPMKLRGCSEKQSLNSPFAKVVVDEEDPYSTTNTTSTTVGGKE